MQLIQYNFQEGWEISPDGQSEFVSFSKSCSNHINIRFIYGDPENPKNAPSDGPNMVALKDLDKLIHSLILYDNLSKNKFI